MIVKMFRKGTSDVWRFSRDGRFAGLIITINGEKFILLDYLAVEEKQRGTGIGTEILQLMRGHYAGKGVFLEIESVYEDCDNKAQRIRRKHFYEKCGFKKIKEHSFDNGGKSFVFIKYMKSKCKNSLS